MPRPVVYGRKIRKVVPDTFTVIATSSSPEQPASQTKNDPTLAITKQLADVRIDAYSKTERTCKDSRALRESHHQNSPLPKSRRTGERSGKAQRAETEEIENHEPTTTEKQTSVDLTLQSINQHDSLTSSRQLRKSPRRKCNESSQRLVHESSIDLPKGSATPNNEALTLDDRQSLSNIQSDTKTAFPLPFCSNREESQDDAYSRHSSELLEFSAHPITSFEKWSTELSEHFRITKIAEASFGEVYRLSLVHEFDDLSHTDESVFKVIALRPPEETLPTNRKKAAALLKKAEAMSKVEDVANEVRLLQRMSFIPGFTNFRDLRVVQGRPPTAFIDAFKAFNAAQKTAGKEPSVFPNPASKTSYTENQLWTIIEMQDAGTDLERLLETGECSSIWTVWDIFWQVVLSLAKGEQGAEFEHRDLHLGNICVRFPVQAQEPDPTRKINFTGLETTIIDYTISRCSIPVLGDVAAETVDEIPACEIAYHDLAAPSERYLFEADSTEEYQYEVYRYMRSAAFLDDPLADFDAAQAKERQKSNTCPTQKARPGRRRRKHQRSWKQFHPITNVVWLHFLLHKLLAGIRWPSTETAPPPPTSRNLARVRRSEKALALESALRDLQFLLDPRRIGRPLPEEHSSLSRGRGDAFFRGRGGDEGGGVGGEEDASNTEVVVAAVVTGMYSASDLAFWAAERAWLNVGDLSG